MIIENEDGELTRQLPEAAKRAIRNCELWRNDPESPEFIENVRGIHIASFQDDEVAKRVALLWNASMSIPTYQLHGTDGEIDLGEMIDSLRNQRDSILLILTQVLETREREAKASAAFNNAAENYADDRKYEDAYVTAAMDAERAEAHARAAIANMLDINHEKVSKQSQP